MLLPASQVLKVAAGKFLHWEKAVNEVLHEDHERKPSDPSKLGMPEPESRPNPTLGANH